MAYIKLEEAIEKIDNLKCECDAHFYGEALTDAKSELLAMHTADVVEVKHGKWINVPPYRAWSGEYLKGQECSVCHSFFISEGNTPYSNHPYCCECGAKMDGGKI